MQKLIYSQLSYSLLIQAASEGKAAGILNGKWESATGDYYHSVVFTTDGYILTHGLAYKVINTKNASDLPTLSNTNGALTFSFGGVTTSSVAVVIGANKGLSVSAGIVGHTNSVTAGSVTPASITDYVLTPYVITYDAQGHISATPTTTTAVHMDYVKDTELDKNQTMYLLGHASLKSIAATLTKESITVTTDENGLATLNTPVINVSGGSSAIKFGTGANATTLYDYVNKTITSGIAANDAMVFVGTVYPDGTIHSVNSNIIKAGTAAQVTNKEADVELDKTKLSDLSKYSAGWTWKVVTKGSGSSAVTEAAIAGIGTVEVGDMIICIHSEDTSYSAADWNVVQANLNGAVTTASNLTTHGVVIANGVDTITTLGVGTSGQYLMSKGSADPEWTSFATLKFRYTKNSTNTDFNYTPSTAATLNIGSGLELDITNDVYTLKHSNSVIALSTAGIFKIAHDTEGHITSSSSWDPNTITFSGVLSGAYNGSALTGTDIPKYDPDGTSQTIKGSRGIVLYTADSSINIGHSNNVTANAKPNSGDTALAKRFYWDEYGHITGYADLKTFTFGAVNSSGNGKFASGLTAHPTYTANAAKTFLLKEGTNVTISLSVSNDVYTYTISSPNTWRPVYAYNSTYGTTMGLMLPTSTGTANLAFGSEFIFKLADTGNDSEYTYLEYNAMYGTTYASKSAYETAVTAANRAKLPEIHIAWAEIDTDGNITYAI